MNKLPLVSCIMPTANRHKFVPLAIRYFLRQNYPNKELIIVDDGVSSVEPLCPDDVRVRYYYSSYKSVVGAKRNLACELANGKIILHWDDDDWYAIDWISKQVKVLLTTHADICGLSQIFFYSPMSNESWKYIYPTNAKHWVAGATMAYLKEAWQKNPFKNIQVGEDNDFVWECAGKVVGHNYVDGFVSIVHSNNTSPKHIFNNQWYNFDSAHILNLLQSDQSHY